VLLEAAISLDSEFVFSLLPKVCEKWQSLIDAVRSIQTESTEPTTIEMLLVDGFEEGNLCDLYARTLGDLCYRFNKFSKEVMLKDAFLSFVFVCFTTAELKTIMLANMSKS
jgi:hypothetical protein